MRLADAQHLPFRNSSLSNIVLFDVLHHLENVRYFFDEALRVLVSLGRIVIMDPYVSVLSWPVYRFFHPEPMDFKLRSAYHRSLCPATALRCQSSHCPHRF